MIISLKKILKESESIATTSGDITSTVAYRTTKGAELQLVKDLYMMSAPDLMDTILKHKEKKKKKKKKKLKHKEHDEESITEGVELGLDPTKHGLDHLLPNNLKTNKSIWGDKLEDITNNSKDNIISQLKTLSTISDKINNYSEDSLSSIYVHVNYQIKHLLEILEVLKQHLQFILLHIDRDKYNEIVNIANNYIFFIDTYTETIKEMYQEDEFLTDTDIQDFIISIADILQFINDFLTAFQLQEDLIEIIYKTILLVNN